MFMTYTLQLAITIIGAIGTLIAGIAVGFYTFQINSRFELHKQRLENLYQPLYSLFDELHLKYAAHSIADLDNVEIEEIIKTIKENVVYADQELYMKYVEFRWSLKSHNPEEIDPIFQELQTITSHQFEELRLKMKLPKLFPKE